MMDRKHIFISYARKDGEFALKLASDLRAAGIDIWLDQLDIAPGARWDREVEEALDACSSLLIILSQQSGKSENVQDEIGFVMNENRPIIPVLYQPCKVPLRLQRLQYIDFTKDYDHGLSRLTNALKGNWNPEADLVLEREDKPVSASSSRPVEPFAGNAGTVATANNPSRRNLLVGVIIGLAGALGLVGYKMIGGTPPPQQETIAKVSPTVPPTQAPSASPQRTSQSDAADPPQIRIASGYFVIGSASANRIDAEKEAQLRNTQGFRCVVVDSSNWENLREGWYSVVYGVYKDQASAQTLQQDLIKRGITGAYIKHSGKKRT